MKKEKTCFLAVIDPTRTDQWALQKAILLAKDRDNADVIALLCAFSDAECNDLAELRKVEMRRQTLWLDEVLSGIDHAGVDIRTIVEWNKDWREAICDVANDNLVDLVVKRASGRPKSLASSDNAVDGSHTALNDAIMDLGKRIRGSNGGIELHAVSAYQESDKFVHPPDVASKLDIDRSQAHVRQGNAGDVIPGLATKIGADLVIVGNVGRRGLSGITIGNTSERILTGIESDVLVLVQEESVERSAA